MNAEQEKAAPAYTKWLGIALMILLPIGLIAFFVFAPKPEEEGATGPGNATRPSATSSPTEGVENPVSEEPEDDTSDEPTEPTEPRPTDGDAWYDYEGEELSREATAELEDQLTIAVENYYAVSASETQEARTKRLSEYFLPDSPMLDTNPLTDGALETASPEDGGRVDLITNVSMVETLQATDTLYSGWMELDTQVVITGTSEEDNYILQGTVVVGVLAAKGDDGVWYVKEIREQST